LTKEILSGVTTADRGFIPVRHEASGLKMRGLKKDEKEDAKREGQ
jgi:hypothetical protein